VKGLSSAKYLPTSGIWPVTFTLLDNDLSKLLEQIQKSRTIVQNFLLAQGFDASEISNAPPQLTDLADNESDDEKRRSRPIGIVRTSRSSSARKRCRR